MRRSLNSGNRTHWFLLPIAPISISTQPAFVSYETNKFGHYLTKHLVLNQYRALAAGDTSAVISEAAPSN